MANIIVAGGLGALGKAVINCLTAQGDIVVVVDLAEGQVDGAQVVIGGVDLTDGEAVGRAYAKAAAELGKVDGLVNVAGGFTWETVANGSDESWDRMYRMNVRSAAVSSKAILSHLATPGGAIVNVGAAAAANVDTGMAPYAASKAGVMALTQGLAAELRGSGVRVNAVLPTILDTPTNRADMPDADFATWVQPEAAAQVIAFLLSPASGSVTGEGIKLSLAG